MTLFFKYIDKYNIEVAPYPLRIGDEDIFTTDEKIYNENGYYRVEFTPYPDVLGKSFIEIYYPPTENIIKQDWEEEVI